LSQDMEHNGKRQGAADSFQNLRLKFRSMRFKGSKRVQKKGKYSKHKKTEYSKKKEKTCVKRLSF